MKYEWKILDLEFENDAIVSAKFLLKASDNENCVETEGYYEFTDKTVKMPLSEIIPAYVISWIENDPIQDRVIALKSNLERQLIALKQKKQPLPWVKPTFKVTL